MRGTRRRFLQKVGGGALGTYLASWLALPRKPLLKDKRYPLTDARAYLNTGGLGPSPYPVLDRLFETTMAQQRLSETGHRLIEAAREPVAAFLGAAPEGVAFTRNATEANNIVAAGLKLRAGDEVIFESHAHPGGSLPWLGRQKRDGIRVRIFEPDPTSAAGNLERIAALITPRTRVIQVSHVTAPTGIRFPVEAIARLARDRGLWFHIDGAQSAGMIPVDVGAIGCDSFATSGHKWVGAPHGTGLVYVHPDRLDEVEPVEVGAYTDARYELPDVFDYYPTARRYEYGTRDAARIAAFAEAVRFLEEIGMDEVARYDAGLAQYLQARLRALPGVTVLTPADPALSAAITTFTVDGATAVELYNTFLNEYDLRCRIVTERGMEALRVSTHIFNDEDECARVVAAARAAAGA